MGKPIGRREMFRAVGAAATAGVLARFAGRAAAPFDSPLLFHSPELEKFVDELPRIPAVRGRRLEFPARTTTHRFHRDLPAVPAFGYQDQSYLGPTIDHPRDEPLQVRFRNELGAHPFATDLDTSIHSVRESYRNAPPASLHLHGGVTPPDSDGHPEQLLMPGQGMEHGYPLRQDAGTLWYHDHAMGITRANVYAGLAGMMLLRDGFDTGEPGNPLGLPAGEFEIPLVLQEKIFRSDGRQSLRSTVIVPEGKWEGGAAGDTGLVNGKVWPQLPVARGLYRFRTINASSFSTWNLFFGNRMRFWVIGTEHGLLDAPVPVREVRLGPGNGSTCWSTSRGWRRMRRWNCVTTRSRYSRRGSSGRWRCRCSVGSGPSVGVVSPVRCPTGYAGAADSPRCYRRCRRRRWSARSLSASPTMSAGYRRRS